MPHGFSLPFLLPLTSTPTLTLTNTPAAGGISATATPFPSGAQPGRNITISQSEKAPVLGESADTVWTALESYPIINPINGESVAPTDLAGEYQALIAEDQLFLFIDVIDDIPQPLGDSVASSNDAVEIFIDGNNSKTESYDSTDDYHLFFGLGSSGIVAGNNSNSIPTDIQHLFTSTDYGYRLEIAIPLASLNVSSGLGEQFGIDIQISDSDGGGLIDDKIAWNTFGNDNWQRPASFGTATVGEMLQVVVLGSDLFVPLIISGVPAVSH